MGGLDFSAGTPASGTNAAGRDSPTNNVGPAYTVSVLAGTAIVLASEVAAPDVGQALLVLTLTRNSSSCLVFILLNAVARTACAASAALEVPFVISERGASSRRTLVTESGDPGEIHTHLELFFRGRRSIATPNPHAR